MDSRTELVIGGRYQVRAVLGRGGTADVYRARDAVTGHDVAVKVFRPWSELVDTDRRRRHEVDVLSTLDHPGLVRLLDADVSDGSAARGWPPYIVFELVDGPTLRNRISHGPLDERAVAGLGASLAEALAYVHRRGIVHRDVKPANILLPDRPHVGHEAKLTDFGVARIVGSAPMTAEGLTVGTANYLSPEQVTSTPVGTPSDVYSLGLVLIEALTGIAAYGGRGIDTALRRLQQQPDVPTDIDPWLSAALTDMTARHPDQRPSAEEAAQLLAVVAEPSLTSDLMALGSRRRPPARHRRPGRRTRRTATPSELLLDAG